MSATSAKGIETVNYIDKPGDRKKEFLKQTERIIKQCLSLHLKTGCNCLLIMVPDQKENLTETTSKRGKKNKTSLGPVILQTSKRVKRDLEEK
jgi:hypothetical protein